MPTNPKWLSTDEQHIWRTFLKSTTHLFDRLDRDLRSSHNLSLPEYEILVHLSEADGQCLRMADLAHLCNQSRSRLSHSISRLERDHLVQRTSCAADGRGVFAHLTKEGLHTLRSAAPTHVAGVRTYLIDNVAKNDLNALRRIMEKASDNLTATHPGYRETRATH